MRRLQSTDALLGPAVADTINALPLAHADTAAARLARQYADTIDQAAQIAAALDDIDDEDQAQRVAALAAKVDAQTVLADLGPKLLHTLDALGATPRARAAISKGGAGGGQKGKLAALREARRPA